MAGCRTNPPWSPQILFGYTHRHTHTVSSPHHWNVYVWLCCTLLSNATVPKIAALLLIMPACPLSIGWSFGQPALRHDDETTSRLCLRSNAILTFLQDENARGHCDITVTMLSVEGVSVTVWLSVCERERERVYCVRNWQWMTWSRCDFYTGSIFRPKLKKENILLWYSAFQVYLPTLA